MTGPRATKLALLLAGTLLLAGCSHTQSVRPGGTIEIQLSEYRLTPQSVRAKPGFFTIVVHNRGVLDHNLVIYHDGQAINSVSPIGPGQTANADVACCCRRGRTRDGLDGAVRPVAGGIWNVAGGQVGRLGAGRWGFGDVARVPRPGTTFHRADSARPRQQTSRHAGAWFHATPTADRMERSSRAMERSSGAMERSCGLERSSRAVDHTIAIGQWNVLPGQDPPARRRTCARPPAPATRRSLTP